MIFTVACNASLGSMKIKENNIRKGICRKLYWKAQPVIQLRWNVSILNAKTLVASISGIQILQYSTQQAIVPGLKDPQKLSNVYKCHHCLLAAQKPF